MVPIALCSDNDLGVRYSAAEALGKLGKVSPDLLEMFYQGLETWSGNADNNWNNLFEFASEWRTSQVEAWMEAQEV
jgi:HEAT repeat protein